MKQLEDGTFYGTTVGLNAIHAQYTKPMLVRVQYSAEDEKSPVRLVAVSGHTLAEIQKTGVKMISREEYENRPINAYNDTLEAIWALGQLGWGTESELEGW